MVANGFEYIWLNIRLGKMAIGVKMSQVYSFIKGKEK